MPGGYWRHRISRVRIDFEKDAAGGAGRKLFLAGIEQEQIHGFDQVIGLLEREAEQHFVVPDRGHVRDLVHDRPRTIFLAGKDKARAGGIEVEEVCVEPVQRAVGHG